MELVMSEEIDRARKVWKRVNKLFTTEIDRLIDWFLALGALFAFINWVISGD